MKADENIKGEGDYEETGEAETAVIDTAPLKVGDFRGYRQSRISRE
jgi:hypothetical protein